jgi:hypothetical protein
LGGSPVGLVLEVGVRRRPATRPATNRTESLLLSSLDLGRICASPALEVQMLADRVVQKAHRR